MIETKKKTNEFSSNGLEGFKTTEIGLLPDNWQVVRLGEITQVIKSSLNPTTYKEELFDYYSIPAYYDIGRPYTERGLAIRSSKIIVKEGTILFAKLNPRVPKIWIVDSSERRKIASTEFIPLYPKFDKTCTDYVYYLCWSKYVLPKSQELVSGSTPSRQRVDVDAFLNVKIPLPPLPEQRAIAHILQTVQRAKEATERVVQATRNLKKSVMRHLFTYGPLPVKEVEKIPLKETEIGLVPEYWDISRIGEVAFVKGGKRLPKGHNFSEHPTRYPYIRVVDFKNGSVDKTNLKFLTPQDYEAIKRYTISSRDVYISIAGTIGLVGIVPLELDGANLTENAAKLVFKDQNQIDQRFVVYFLSSKSGQEQISIRTTKTSQPKLALARIKQIPIPLPPLSEQRKIAGILAKIDEKIQAEEARKQALDALFKTLLHHLMTGKIRVNPSLLKTGENDNGSLVGTSRSPR